MNFSLMTISELDRVAKSADNELAIALNEKLQDLIDAIEDLDSPELEESDRPAHIEWIKKLAELANNY